MNLAAELFFRLGGVLGKVRGWGVKGKQWLEGCHLSPKGP